MLQRIIHARARSLLLFILFNLAPLTAHAQILQLVPSTHIDRAPQSFLEACMNVERWPTLYARTSYLGAVSWQLRSDRAANVTLARCFTRMRTRDLQLSLEISVTGAFATGADAYQEGLADWQRYQDLGAPLAAFFIDEPLTNGLRLQNLSYASVVREMVDWIVLVRQNPRFANIRLILIEAYPHIGASMISDFINDVNNGAALRGVGGLDGLQIDHAWDGVTPWSGADLGLLRAAAHKRRMDFSIILYAAMPFRDPTNDCDFRARLYQQWAAYKLNGIDTYDFYPDIYTIQSWDQLPSVTVPESASRCTFMEGAKSWLDSVDIVPAIRPGPYQRPCAGILACESPVAQ